MRHILAIAQGEGATPTCSHLVIHTFAVAHDLITVRMRETPSMPEVALVLVLLLGESARKYLAFGLTYGEVMSVLEYVVGVFSVAQTHALLGAVEEVAATLGGAGAKGAHRSAAFL